MTRLDTPPWSDWTHTGEGDHFDPARDGAIPEGEWTDGTYTLAAGFRFKEGDYALALYESGGQIGQWTYDSTDARADAFRQLIDTIDMMGPRFTPDASITRGLIRYAARRRNPMQDRRLTSDREKTFSMDADTRQMLAAEGQNLA